MKFRRLFLMILFSSVYMMLTIIASAPFIMIAGVDPKTALNYGFLVATGLICTIIALVHWAISGEDKNKQGP